MNYANLFMILFCYSGIISLFFGVYGLHTNIKSKLNKAFFASTVSLCIWAFGFGAFFISKNVESAFMWRRFAAVGCATFYAFLLHFLLILTDKNRLLASKMITILIYFPAAICVYIFGISKEHSQIQYNFVRTVYGWNTLPTHSFWENFFFLYFILYTIIGLAVVFHWGIKKNNMDKRKVAYLIFFSFLGDFLIGSVTDVVANIFLPAQIPQIVPILSVIPIGVIYYAMIKYGFLLPSEEKIDVTIFSDITRDNVYRYLSSIYVFGSIMSFCLHLLYDGKIQGAIVRSGAILLLGILIQIIISLKRFYRYQDLFLTGIMFISVPIVIFVFLDYESITIWAASTILIIVALIFIKKAALILLTLSVITTQIIVWILVPEKQVSINSYTHITRIVILSLIIWMAFYVNKVYVNRLEENARQIKLQKLISDISTNFIVINDINSNGKFYKSLTNIGTTLEADRCGIFCFEEKTGAFRCISEWYDKEKVSIINQKPVQFCPWSIERFKRNEIIQINQYTEIPVEAQSLKNELERRQIKAMIALPIFANSKLFGVMSIEFVHQYKVCSDEQEFALKIVSNILSDALIKIDAEKEIKYMAYHDYLTRLPNRRLLNDSLKQSILLSEQSEKRIAIFFIDLDGFKGVNDTLGHEGGDILLKNFADRLLGVVSEDDIVSRFGGDEFLLVTNHISDQQDISYIAEQIMKLFNQPFLIRDQEFYLTASIGISVYPFDGNEVDELIKYADIAMYKAKGKGKNQYFICSSEMKNDVAYKIRITNDLYKVLDRNELYLNYQPQVDLMSGEIIGVEALIRWNHPELGLISPAVFIPIAEQNGMINNIGEWVIKQSCMQNREWQRKGCKPICVAINVSGNQLRDINLIKEFEKILAFTELEPKYIEVEVTEGVAMDELSNSVYLLNRLKDLGIMISIDDFGTDYSSLGRIKKLPIDKLKIDKQFIDDIENGEKDKAIIRTIIQLAKNLQIKVIAEGVENEKQLDFLKQELCDEIQGYYFYKPLPPEEIEKLLLS